MNSAYVFDYNHFSSITTYLNRVHDYFESFDGKIIRNPHLMKIQMSANQAINQVINQYQWFVKLQKDNDASVYRVQHTLLMMP